MAAMCPKLMMDIDVRHATQSSYENIPACSWYLARVQQAIECSALQSRLSDQSRMRTTFYAIQQPMRDPLTGLVSDETLSASSRGQT